MGLQLGGLFKARSLTLATHLALEARDALLALGRHARAVAVGDGRDTPRARAVNLRVVGEVGLLVADGHIDAAVVDEEGERGHVGELLSTVLGRSRGESGRVFAVEGLRGPEAAGLVKEARDLRGGTTVTRGDAEDEAVHLGQVVGLEERVLGVEGGAGVHLLKHLGGEGFLDEEGPGDASSGLDTGDNLLGEGG